MGTINAVTWVNGITIATVVLSIAKYWYLGKGKDGVVGNCVLQMVACVLQFVYNALIFYINPDLWGSLLYQPLLVFGYLMAIKGLNNAD